MGLYVNNHILPYLVTAAEGDLVENELWVNKNGSMKRFEVFFEDCDSEVISASYKDVKFVINAEDGQIIQVIFKEPENLVLEITDIANALIHPDSRVA